MKRAQTRKLSVCALYTQLTEHYLKPGNLNPVLGTNDATGPKDRSTCLQTRTALIPYSDFL